MAALRILFFVMFVALAGSTAEAWLGIPVSLEVKANVTCPSGSVLQGTEVNLQCNNGLLPTTLTATANASGYVVFLTPPSTIITSVLDILNGCSVTVSGPLSEVCLGDATVELDVGLESALTYIGSTVANLVTGIKVNIIHLIANRFVVITLN